MVTTCQVVMTGVVLSIVMSWLLFYVVLKFLVWDNNQLEEENAKLKERVRDISCQNSRCTCTACKEMIDQ